MFLLRYPVASIRFETVGRYYEMIAYTHYKGKKVPKLEKPKFIPE